MQFTQEMELQLVELLRDYGLGARFLFSEISASVLEEMQTLDFAGVEIHILEPSELLQYAHTEKIPLDESFDTIFCGDILERVQNMEKFLQNARSHLRGNGKLIFVLHEADPQRIQQAIPMLKRYFEEISIVQMESAYLVKMGKYYLKEKTAWLRSSFSPELRNQIVILLRRIENDIDRSTNCRQLIELCERYRVSKEYLDVFICDTMLDPARVRDILWTVGGVHENEP